MRKRPHAAQFPPELRSLQSSGGRRLRWHAALADWLKANGLKGALVEIRAMTNPELSTRLVADPDSSIGGKVHRRRIGPSMTPESPGPSASFKPAAIRTARTGRPDPAVCGVYSADEPPRSLAPSFSAVRGRAAIQTEKLECLETHDISVAHRHAFLQA